jgi:hypothetical protein
VVDGGTGRDTAIVDRTGTPGRRDVVARVERRR